MTSWARSRASSLVRMRLTWVLAVYRLMYSRSAISALEQSLGDQDEDFGFAFGELGELGGRVGWCRCGGEALDEPAGDAGGEEGLAGGDDPDGVEDVFWSGVFEEEPAGAVAQRLVDVVVEVEGGEDDDPRPR